MLAITRQVYKIAIGEWGIFMDRQKTPGISFPTVVFSVVLLVALVAIVSVTQHGGAPTDIPSSENLAGQATDTVCPGVTIASIDQTVRVTANVPFSKTISASGYDSITVTGLPQGITFNPSTRTISGTATATTQAARATIRATKGACTATEGFAIKVIAQYNTPDCGLHASNPVIGQSTTLNWYVSTTDFDKPTSGSMNPSIGTQDYTMHGSAQTGPITQPTTYRLTVTNPAGSYTCEQTITPTATAADVVFEQRLTTPEEGQMRPREPWEHLYDTLNYLSDGSLVVNGACGPSNYRLEGGTYLFTPDGTYKGTADTCLDTAPLSATPICGDNPNGCTLSHRSIDAPGDYFIRDGTPIGTYAIRRSPVVYRVTPQGLTKNARIFFNTVQEDDPEWDPKKGPFYFSTQVIGDKAIFIKAEAHKTLAGTIGGLPRYINQITTQIAAYQLPELTPVWETAPLQEFTNVWIGSAGPYYLMAQNPHEIQNGRAIYNCVVIASTVGTNGLVEKNRVDLGVNTRGFCGNFENDPTDPTVFAITRGTTGTPANPDLNRQIIRFRATPEGIVKIDERMFSQFVSYAIAGDYVAFGGSYGGGVLRVVKGTQELTITHPDDAYRYVGSGKPLKEMGVLDVDIRKDGKIAVTSGVIFQYQINNFAAGTPAPSVDDMDETIADLPAVECENDLWCDVNERCESGSCVPITTTNRNANQNANTNAQFSAETATCVTSTGRIFCTTPVSYTSDGVGYVQLWREGGTQYHCAPAGTSVTKNLMATQQPRTYALYAATDCEPENADTSTALDTITVQSTAS